MPFPATSGVYFDAGRVYVAILNHPRSVGQQGGT